jgi:hypothetical protein
LGVVLKGMGYRGIHIAGVHRGFELVGRILDRMEQITAVPMLIEQLQLVIRVAIRICELDARECP